tara:strand:+ start:27099 stop:27941 length:843 start_codon:yes stop_codon:yes gene_type:complete
MTIGAGDPRILRVARKNYDLYAQTVTAECADAPWIVFSNSLATDMTVWDAQVAALAGRFRILRYDQAGHGRSGLPQTPINFDDLGDDLLAVMDAASVESATFVGLSMGVPTGLAAHRRAANRFEALVLCDGQAKTAPGGAANWAERIEGAKASGMQTFASETANRWLTDGAAGPTRARLIEMIAATPLDGFEACARALMDYDFAGELTRIACPTLLVAGAEDGAMPESMAAKLKPVISGATLQIIAQAGHVPCFEQPQAFTAVLCAFLDKNRAKIARVMT